MWAKSGDKAGLPTSPLRLLFWGHQILWSASLGQGPDCDCLWCFVPPQPQSHRLSPDRFRQDIVPASPAGSSH